MKGIYSNDKEILDSGLESQRRYSDFEVLVSVLQKLYKGVILPPLPPKTWTSQLQQQTQPSQLFAIQRLSELQLFITSLLSHPIIKNSYELRNRYIVSETLDLNLEFLYHSNKFPSLMPSAFHYNLNPISPHTEYSFQNPFDHLLYSLK